MDVLVAGVVWAIGAVLFIQFEDREDLDILLFSPAIPALMFFWSCTHFSWAHSLVWLVVPPVLVALLTVQFTMRRSLVGTALGALAVGLWWACGVFGAFAMAALSPWG